MKSDKTIIDKIREKNIKQKPKWQFKLTKIVIWICYLLCIVIGAASFSVILFSIQQTDFNILSHLSHSKIELFLGLLPFFWIFIMLTFVFLSFFVLRKSPKGYKYRRFHLFIFNTLISIALGTITYFAGGGHQLEHAFAERVTYYESVQTQKIKTWMQPDMGFLAGTLIEIRKDTLVLKDFNKDIWTIIYNDAFIAHRVSLQPESKIKIIGEKTHPHQFKAVEIRPWIGKYSRQNWTPSP